MSCNFNDSKENKLQWNIRSQNDIVYNLHHFHESFNRNFKFGFDCKDLKKTQRSKNKCNKSTDTPFLSYNTQQDKRMCHKKQGNTCVKMKRHFRLSLLFGIAILQLPCKYKSFLFFLCNGKNYSVNAFQHPILPIVTICHTSIHGFYNCVFFSILLMSDFSI